MERNTRFGVQDDSEAYKKMLISIGYVDWDWRNGFSKETHKFYNTFVNISKDHEHIQWNNSGSDTMDVYHDIKIFSSTDMGD